MSNVEQFDGVRAIGNTDIALHKLLDSSGVVTADLATTKAWFFALRGRGGTPIAAYGLELGQRNGLLRSVAVDPDHRGRSLGTDMVHAAEHTASVKNIRTLWLLTETADRFFAKLNYEYRVRDDAPALVRASAQFVSHCPGDAILMSKHLVS